MQALEQKESLGEYGSGWGWDGEMPHAFDQTDIDGMPKQYFSNGTQEGICKDGADTTNGHLLYSQSQMFNQKSCKPYSSNAGNYYSWPAATAGGSALDGNATNSVCPKGWILPTNIISSNSFENLVLKVYAFKERNSHSIDNVDITNNPTSFTLAGLLHTGTPIDRNNNCGFWSSGDTWFLKYSGSTILNPTSYFKAIGLNLRCVTR